MSVTELERSAEQESKLSIVDCDIHPAISGTPEELFPFMETRWRDEYLSTGPRVSQPFFRQVPYPRLTPGNGMRGDSWPANGGPPGSDLGLMREQLLDAFDIECGVLLPIVPSTLNLGLGAAMCGAVNEWQLSKWLGPEPRLRGTLCVTQEDPDAAIAEIEKHAGNRAFVQIGFTPRTIEPLGRKRYWPVLEAAAAHGLPIGLHAAVGGTYANSGTGWFGTYWEEHTAYTFAMQTLITSLVMEGVFERIPDLKVVAVEGGFGWAPSLGWRLDRSWARMRSEVPHVTRPPSEYMRENIWYTTQPIEEPETPGHLHDVIRWIGADRLLFSTDYPHWDFDDPRHAFKVRLSAEDHKAIFGGNARRLYGLN
jgi:predicted TIM-barrel fold metal-dependent hydrolase